jgi:SynChlorMet cassette radical SAM/SPASM protein ScmE
MKVMKTPRAVDISITNKCNLRCSYCSHFTSAGDINPDLPAGDWLAFFEELKECSVMGITLGGGEPFIRGDILEIIDGMARNHMRYSILSNGTLITDDIAAHIAATGRNDYVQVSIDGGAPPVHDIHRGKGNFLKAVEGIRTLQEHGVKATVRVTINRDNVRELENIARFLLVDLGLAGFSTNSATYMGLCRQNPESIQLNTPERMLAMSTLLRLDQEYGGRITGTAGPISEARMWREMEQARRDGKASLPGRGYLTSCGGLFSKLAVRADGVIIPCTLLSHIELGHIGRDRIADVWTRHPEVLKMRSRRDMPLSDFDQCRGCAYVNYCSGSCPAVAYNITGDTYRPSPDACLRLFLEEGGIIPGMPFEKTVG